MSDEHAFNRLGDSMHTEFRRLSAIAMPADEFWRRLAMHAVEQIDLIRAREEREERSR
jgi:hypothetical protein